MQERYITQFIQNLIDRFDYLTNEKFDLDAELNHLIDPITRNPIDIEIRQLIEAGFLERMQYKRSRSGAVLVPVSVVVDPRGHEEWYSDWLINNNDNKGSYYWKRLEDFLSRELTAKYGPDNAGEIVKSIDSATVTILDKLANPLRRQFSYKGLVVGYVQSGKTANFTALIAKAVDAGYKLIIVLAGIHNVLRRQTQVRLDRELTGIRDIDGPENYISLPGATKTWNRLTTAHNDFTRANLGLFSNFCQLENPTIGVLKKNVKILDRLIGFISEADIEVRSNVPVLIIDDEADQASINGNANDPDSDPTSTNERIRSLLSLFQRKAYVGYTATPFANVLINMNTEHGSLEDDLYPRNFIVSLPEPKGYFGSALIFQGSLSDIFVKEIPDEGNDLIRYNRITNNLSVAVDHFIIGSAIRNLRGDQQKPMTMLVHVSHRINTMSVVKEIINDYILEINEGYTREDKGLEEDYQNIWNEYIEDSREINRQLDLDRYIPEFSLVWSEIKKVFSKLQVLELNSSSEDNLDFSTGEEIKAIAVGGNRLSRGLTLEGLMISYYLRESLQYDTLLQMGRWFGYRKGYEDSTRVHTTSQIWGYFEHLALVEAELRSEIYRYEEEGKTPLQMALAIRSHLNLKVTAKNKMGAARPRQVSYSGSLNQTIWFLLDRPDILNANLNLGQSFIRNINNEMGFTNVRNSGVFLANGKVDGVKVLDSFLNRYKFAERDDTGGPGLDSDSLLSYIFRRISDTNSELNSWSVAVVGNAKPNKENDSILFGGIKINRIQRSRKFTQKGYNIGVLTEPDHLSIDLASNETRSSQNPLLLLYVIWKESKAGKPVENPVANSRIDLYKYVNSEKVDVLGLAIVLPISRYEPNSYIGQ